MGCSLKWSRCPFKGISSNERTVSFELYVSRKLAKKVPERRKLLQGNKRIGQNSKLYIFASKSIAFAIFLDRTFVKNPVVNFSISSDQKLYLFRNHNLIFLAKYNFNRFRFFLPHFKRFGRPKLCHFTRKTFLLLFFSG